jgi:hypothetical protein
VKNLSKIDKIEIWVFFGGRGAQSRLQERSNPKKSDFWTPFFAKMVPKGMILERMEI